jgi:L-seryl-tRNA(Ser) seleniumtransferase
LQRPEVETLIGLHGRPAVVRVLREVIANRRAAWLERKAAVREDDIIAEVGDRLAASAMPSLRPAVNATGVVLHTGLGRAVLAEAARRHVESVTAGHSTLEIDLATGERGSRHEHVSGLLRELTGAGDAIVVNNDAGAVLLALAALASGREVIVSRGELVEIGGGFRVPEVMEQSGARLVEVGTTNKTRAADYEKAVTANTAALLKVHRSNFRVTGFTEEATLGELSGIATRRGIALLDDLGSGALVDMSGCGLSDEPTVQERLAQGADVVMFSGDKLLGGPQAGIIVGRADLVDRMRRHPLARALRCDKTTLAALEGTLRVYRAGRQWEDIPTLRALAMSAEDTRAAAVRLADELRLAPGVQAEVVPSVNRAGAGTMPGQDLSSFAVAVEVDGLGPSALAAALRGNEPPIVGHIADDRYLLEPRTLLPGENAVIAEALRRITGRAV